MVSDEPTTRSERGSALGGALLAFVVLVVVLMTWAPFDFAWPEDWTLTWWSPPRDLLLNVALFVPLGFLFSAAAARSRQPSKRDLVAAWAFLAGVALSAVIEGGQLFLFTRYTTPVDIVTNGIGAWLGAAIHLTMARGLARRLPGHPALELPLMSLVVLSTIVAWLDGLAARDDPWRPVLVPILVVASASIVADVWRSRLAAAFTRHQVTVAFVLWVVVATLPTWLTAPAIAAVCPLIGGAIVWVVTGRPLRQVDGERRFEHDSLRRAAPFLALYLLGLALWPLGAFDVPSLAFPVTELTEDSSLPKILAFLERVVTFTLLGFLVAEIRGRRDATLGRTLPPVGMIAVFSVVAFQSLRGAHEGIHASMAEGVAQILAALIGALLYRRQLTALRVWIVRGEERAKSVLIDDLLQAFDPEEE